MYPQNDNLEDVFNTDDVPRKLENIPNVLNTPHPQHQRIREAPNTQPQTQRLQEVTNGYASSNTSNADSDDSDFVPYDPEKLKHTYKTLIGLAILLLILVVCFFTIKELSGFTNLKTSSPVTANLNLNPAKDSEPEPKPTVNLTVPNSNTSTQNKVTKTDLFSSLGSTRTNDVDFTLISKQPTSKDTVKLLVNYQKAYSKNTSNIYQYFANCTSNLGNFVVTLTRTQYLDLDNEGIIPITLESITVTENETSSVYYENPKLLENYKDLLNNFENKK